MKMKSKFSVVLLGLLSPFQTSAFESAESVSELLEERVKLEQSLDEALRTYWKRARELAPKVEVDSSGNAILKTHLEAEEHCKEKGKKLIGVYELKKLQQLRSNKTFHQIFRETEYPGVSIKDPRVLIEIRELDPDGFGLEPAFSKNEKGDVVVAFYWSWVGKRNNPKIEARSASRMSWGALSYHNDSFVRTLCPSEKKRCRASMIWSREVFESRQLDPVGSGFGRTNRELAQVVRFFDGLPLRMEFRDYRKASVICVD